MTNILTGDPGLGGVLGQMRLNPVAAQEIHGKVALVTGASSGLGLGFAEALAGAGAKVIGAARHADKLQRAVDKIRAAGGTAHAMTVDVGSVRSIRELVAAIADEVGPIDILVNNAGVSREEMLLEVEEEDFDLQVGTNFKGAFFTAQAVARQMVANKIEGRIVNIGSIAGSRPVGKVGIYGASKAAVVHMTRQMAREWGRYGINTNAICPGYIATELNAEFLATEAGRKMASSLPRRRVGEPEDLKALLLLLCAGRSVRLLNGSIVAADDGFTCF
ncbi:SDR family NAD(P)-dependent oxidoreductase [Xanthobacter sp. KR7-65]|uniref:SDR family NAD(P)-dependent oxidoreductase n=1 Tax=Xanthobacter sp. KR7-65 TaxID=3156612 RepID=UPI0032B335E6